MITVPYASIDFSATVLDAEAGTLLGVQRSSATHVPGAEWHGLESSHHQIGGSVDDGDFFVVSVW